MKDIIIILGPQGSGKSTQAKMLAEKYDWPIFIAGDQLRDFAKLNTPESRKIADLLSNGQLVPNEIVINLIKRFLSLNNGSNTYLFDGFPRSLDQCQFVNELARSKQYQITAVLIDISEKETLKRLTLRAKDNSHQRNDDTPEVIKQRLSLYREETLPVLSYLEKNFRLIKMNGEKPIQMIFENLIKELKKINAIK